MLDQLQTPPQISSAPGAIFLSAYHMLVIDKMSVNFENSESK